MTDLLAFDPRFHSIVGPDAQLRCLGSGAEWAEGPVYLPDRQVVLFSDIPGNRLLCWSPSDGVTVERYPSEFVNGNTLDRDGNLLHCSHGARAIQRTLSNHARETLVDRWGGRRLNSPNDLVVHPDGSIWFTDPPYGIVSNREGYKADSEIAANYVFRFDPTSGEIQPVVTDVEEPNGLAFSPDLAWLYVADTSAALRTDGSGNHHIRRYRLHGNRALDGEVFAVIDPGLADGFRLDVSGNLFTSSADSIQVFAADGTLLGKIFVPEKVSNCCWGGPEKNVLFITATTSLYSIQLTTTGAGLFW